MIKWRQQYTSLLCKDVRMTEVQVAHTAQLDPAALDAAHDLLRTVFAGELSADDWEHALGGMHALVWEDAELVGHAAVVQRRLLHGGRAWRAGYVEGVGVRADRQGYGYGAALMAAIEPVVGRAYDLGALGATEAAVRFYRARGWQRWLGPCSALTPSGIVRTPEEDGGIYVLPGSFALDLG